MPLLRKKAYSLAQFPNDLKPGEELFVIPETEECFRNYEEYIRKVFLYGSQVWSCQYSGHSGLTYKDALESEKDVLKQLKGFPDCFKVPVLKMVHQGEGNLGVIVERCVKLLKSEYFTGEEVYIINNKTGKKSHGIITEILRSSGETVGKDVAVADKENSLLSLQREKVIAANSKYNIQLRDSEVILSDVSHDDTRRKVKVPSKELLKIFIKSSARKFSIKGKEMWLAKDELIRKYNLPEVPKVTRDALVPKTPGRNPLHTISGQNEESAKKIKTKSSLKKSPQNDPTQKTLNFFLKDPQKDAKVTIPADEKSATELTPTKSLRPEIEICLTPNSKLQKLRTSSGVLNGSKVPKEKKDKPNDENRMTTQEKALGEGDHFDHKANDSELSPKKPAQISQKQKCKERKKKPKTGPQVVLVDDDDKMSSCGKEPVEIIDTDVVVHGKSYDHCKKSMEKAKNDEVLLIDNDYVDKMNDQNRSVTVDQDFGEKEKNIVRKNTLKKQKTLSQMLNFSVLKKSPTAEDHRKTVQVSKSDCIASSTALPRPTSTAKPKDDLQVIEEIERKKWEMRESMLQTNTVVSKAIMLREDSELALGALPSPKPVPVPDGLQQSYGDILMIAEFLHTYRSLVGQGDDLRVNPDELIGALMSGECDIFYRILIAFIKILLKDLHDNESSKKLSELGVDLFDIHLTKETVSEVIRVYLNNEQGEQNRLANDEKMKIVTELSPNILTDLEEKEIAELLPTQKIEVLVYLLEKILESDLFYCHIDDLERKRKEIHSRRQDSIKEMKSLEQQLKDKEDTKHGQKDIAMFMVKDQVNDKVTAQSEKVDHAEEATERGNNGTIVAVRPEKNTSAMKEDNARSGMSKRQELVAQNKIDKEKEDEIRRLSEELYQRNQKLERLKKSWQELIESRRVRLLGIDRDYSRYWMFPGYPVGLFVEKKIPHGTVEIDNGGVRDESWGKKVSERKEKWSWYYYDSKEGVKSLINSLSPLGVRESALRSRLKIVRNELNFSNRPLAETTNQHENFKEPVCSLKEELVDLGSRITSGYMGDLPDFECWVVNVNNCSSASDLLPYAVELGSSVAVRNLSKSLTNPEEWLNEQWIPAIKNARTLSRLHFCLNLLDCCIKWDECTLYLKCKVCRKNGGAMVLCEQCRKGYHVDCLRPALQDVPSEDWLCPSCNPTVSRRRTARREDSKKENECLEEDVETSGEDEEGEESEVEKHINEDYCDVCGGGGDLVCCDNCPKVYHKECHDPPMRNVPRGVWKCCRCQERPLAVRKRRQVLQESESSESDSSDSESSDSDSSVEEGPTVRKRTRRAANTELIRKSEPIQKKKSDNETSRVLRKRKLTPPRAEKSRFEDGVKRKIRQDPELKKCELLLRDLTRHEDSWPFLQPVDLSEVPDYLEVVTCPMDFETIRKKLDGLEYSNCEYFLKDVQLVFSNSEKYNLETSDHGLAGISLASYFKKILPFHFPGSENLVVLRRNSSRRNRKKC